MTGPVHKWPADKLATMAKLRRMGVPVEDIATRYGISKRRVHELLADTASSSPAARSETGSLSPPAGCPSHLSLRSHDPAPESEYMEGTWSR